MVAKARRRRKRRGVNELALFDDFRGGIPVSVAMVPSLVAAGALGGETPGAKAQTVLVVACVSFALAFLAYLVWTHVLFARTPAAQVRAVALADAAGPRAWWRRFFSFGSSEGWALSAALIAFVGSLAISVYGVTGGGVQFTVVALFMAGTAWATVSYTYALRYFRLHLTGDPFTFDFDGEPSFMDFLSAALMVSSAGAHVGAVPTTRSGMRAVRSHTVISFVFNALVIAVTVSLISNLVDTYGS